MQLPIDNPQSTLLTLHDAITDSPVYRSTTLHFDDQLDLLEKWLESLSKYMKLYVNQLNKFNLETNTLCKKVIPVGIDDSMIDPNFTGAVIKNFSDALQTGLAFKTKLVSDLEDNFIQPLQSFVKTNLKEFKEFRKQHERTLEKYDAQLSKYTAQSRTKEASAVREEAFRLYEARKAYVRMSGQHVVRILHFRSLLEHFLVERFSLASSFHLKDIEGASDSWSKLQTKLISWKQWLLDDKDTCNYQLYQLQSSRITLEKKFLGLVHPARDLEKYSANQTVSNRHSLDYSSVLNGANQPSHKWGYLFARGARNYWARRWFFVYDGCFGSCNVNASGRLKGTITMGERVSVLLCDIKPWNDGDRRYCFEVKCAHQPPFVLQAETEEEMREWMGVFEKSKRLMLQTEQLLDYKSGAPTTTNTSSSAADVEASTLDIAPPKSNSTALVAKAKPTTMLDELPAVSTSSPLINSTAESPTTEQQQQKPSIVMLSSSAETDQPSLAQSTSLTPLLVWEASRASLNASTSSTTSAPASPATQSFSAAALSLDAALVDSDENNHSTNGASLLINGEANGTSSSWGIPWALVPSMFQGGSTDDIASELPPTPGSPNIPAVTDADGHQIIWPTRVDDSNVPKVELSGYPSNLDTRNRELRHLFGGVSPSEVVLTTFIGLLKKKPLTDQNGQKDLETPTSPTITNNTVVDSSEQEFNSQLPSAIKEPSSSYGYSYTGRGFITQETFWFYSCVLMNCVNTVAIRLCDIKAIRLIRDPSVANIGTSSNLALAIDLAASSGTHEAQTPLIFTTLMEDIEVVAEKLKFAVSNAKSAEPESLQTTYDVIHSLSAVNNKSKSTNQVRTIIKSATDPVRSTSDNTNNNSSTVSLSTMSSSANSLLDPAVSPIPSRSSDIKKKTSKTPRKHSAPVQPKSGALAAAMMAATVAGGSGFLGAGKGIQDEPRGLLRKKKSKAALQSDDNSEVPPIPLPSSGVSSSASSMVNVPSRLADSTTFNNAALTSEIPQVPKIKDPHAVPDDFKIPSAPVSCGCENHLDKLEAEIEVPISAKHLYYIMFAEENYHAADIWEKKTAENKSKDLTMTPWQTVDGKKERTLKYIIPVNNAMVKLKEAEVVEKQVVEKKEEYLCYVVLTSTKTAQLPYADAFVPYVKYCITWVSPDRCKLSCYTGVKFLKNILVKGMVNKAAMKGMSENIAVFMPIVQQEASRETHRKRSGSKEKADQVSLKRIGTIRRPSTKDSAQVTDEKEKEETSGWYGQVESIVTMIQDVAEVVPFVVKVGIAVVVLLWFMYSWLRAGSREQWDVINVPAQGQKNTQVSSRAVYLRDIDEGLLNVEIQPAYGHSDSFRSFLEYKSFNRTLGTHHRWYSSHHHQFAIELLFSRERLAMLRHDTLVLFQLVNEVDAQLLENEYTNWLMDTRLRCRTPDADYEALHCDDVKRQLRSFPLAAGAPHQRKLKKSNPNKLQFGIKLGFNGLEGEKTRLDTKVSREIGGSQKESTPSSKVSTTTKRVPNFAYSLITFMAKDNDDVNEEATTNQDDSCSSNGTVEQLL
ncbi:hypothetical protein [Parasitella parasitica]|uniref:Uncharacterized protein n=1 Tax=Parasitella parasitica TaxID=35722 RepID=A0A0B7NBP7_9FUNG|nr:hypothetical protein [Parasitella parasitica]